MEYGTFDDAFSAGQTGPTLSQVPQVPEYSPEVQIANGSHAPSFPSTLPPPMSPHSDPNYGLHIPVYTAPQTHVYHQAHNPHPPIKAAPEHMNNPESSYLMVMGMKRREI